MIQVPALLPKYEMAHAGFDPWNGGFRWHHQFENPAILPTLRPRVEGSSFRTVNEMLVKF